MCEYCLLMRYIYIAFIILFAILTASASDVRLHVMDDRDEIVAGATCVCVALPDSTFYNYAITDGSGFSTLQTPDTDWYIDISSVGYYSTRMPKVAFADNIAGNRPMEIRLSPKDSELSEVVVKAPKGDMTMKNGIISFNNLDEIMQTRVVTSAHDLLKSLPLITSVDGNSLTLSGAPLGSVIYINGRPSNMDSTALIDYLKSIPPEMVQDIEIIYTPSPKWKTRSSVINVKIKRQVPYSFNGRVQASGSWQHALAGRAGTSLFFGLPKVSVNAGYYFRSGKSFSKETFLSHHTVGENVYDVENIETERSLTDSHNLFAMIDYQINRSNSLSVNYNGRFVPKSDKNQSTENSYYGIYDSRAASDNNFNAVSINYSNSIGFDAGMDYSHFAANQRQVISSDEAVALTGQSRQTVNFVKAYVDARTNLGKDWVLSYGAMYCLTENGNRLVNISDDSEMESDDVESRNDEQIATAYVGVQKSFFNNKLSASASLKGEMYRLGDYRKNQLLPTVSITYMPSYTNIFQLSYQSYRGYPSLWQRQDYKSYTNPYQLSEGNPNLKPATYHIASLLYLFRQKYTLSLSYYRVSDFFLDQAYQSDEALVLISKPYNIEYSSSLDLSLTIPISIGKVFYSNILLNVTYDKFKSSDWHNLAFCKARLTGGVMIDNVLTICQKPKISINLTGMYKMPSVLGIWEREHGWLLNAGVSGAFLNDNLTVALTGFDLLQTVYTASKVRLGSQWMDISANKYSRSIKLNIAYNFKGYKEKNLKTYDTSRYGIE